MKSVVQESNLRPLKAGEVPVEVLRKEEKSSDSLKTNTQYPEIVLPNARLFGNEGIRIDLRKLLLKQTVNMPSNNYVGFVNIQGK